ncbi:MAG: hypothetical protein C0621_11080 [Desulfuromonas sp.]|nr:MAG: hypothetical protein C0621_11080 [Desulfuromonas sp.]
MIRFFLKYILDISFRAHYLVFRWICVDFFLSNLKKESIILEIGGGYNPRFLKSEYKNVYHMDHCSKESLKNKYGKDGSVSGMVGNIQEVDFILKSKSFSEIIPDGLLFDFIYSSHVIEHQLDLVCFFTSIENSLKDSGNAVLIVPDMGSCFDRFRFPTVTSDVVSRHQIKKTVHQGKQVYEALSQSININPGRKIFESDLRDVFFTYDMGFAYGSLIEAESPESNYKDVHAWAFTPDSFRLLMVELFLLGLVELEVVRITPVYGNQFGVFLKKTDVDRRFTLFDLYKKDRVKLAKKVYRF